MPTLGFRERKINGLREFKRRVVEVRKSGQQVSTSLVPEHPGWVETLQPDVTRPNATATHKALLRLARDAEGRTRLITTNFDRLFEHVADGTNTPVDRHKAPLLPVREDDGVDAESPVTRALNHPVGQVIEGLLDNALMQAGGNGLPAAAKRPLEMV